MAVFVVAAPEVLFVSLFEYAAFFFYYQTFIGCGAFDLQTAPAHSYIGILEELLCFAEVFICLEPDFIIIEQTADVPYHNIVIHTAGKGHDLPVAQLFPHNGFCLFKGKVFI